MRVALRSTTSACTLPVLALALSAAVGCGQSSPPAEWPDQESGSWSAFDSERCGDDPANRIDQSKLHPLDPQAACRVEPAVGAQCAADPNRSLRAPLTCRGTPPPHCLERREQRLAPYTTMCLCMTAAEYNQYRADCATVP